jgi:hypothetical protein
MGVGIGGVTSASARVRRMPVCCLAPQLVPSRLWPNGTSNSASRHRPQRPQPQGSAPSHVAGGHPNSPTGGRERASLEGASCDLLLAQRARRMGEEGYAHRSCAPGVRTRDHSNCEIKGGAPSTGAVGATCMPFLEKKILDKQLKAVGRHNERAWKEHLLW